MLFILCHQPPHLSLQNSLHLLFGQHCLPALLQLGLQLLVDLLQGPRKRGPFPINTQGTLIGKSDGPGLPQSTHFDTVGMPAEDTHRTKTGTKITFEAGAQLIGGQRVLLSMQTEQTHPLLVPVNTHSLLLCELCLQTGISLTPRCFTKKQEI